MKSFAAYSKARLEGRTARSAKTVSKHNPETQFNEAVVELTRHKGEQPLWGRAAKLCMATDAALAVDMYLAALEGLIAENIKQELKVPVEAAVR